MGAVVQFGWTSERGWKLWEPIIRELLSRAGAPQAMTDWICLDMEPRFLALPAVFQVAGMPDEGREIMVDSLRKTSTEFFQTFIGELVKIEMDLFVAKFGRLAAQKSSGMPCAPRSRGAPDSAATKAPGSGRA
jgi:hypothetical protein